MYMFPHVEQYYELNINDSVKFLYEEDWIEGVIISFEDNDRYTIKSYSDNSIYNQIHISKIQPKKLYNINDKVFFYMNNDWIPCVVTGYKNNK